MLFHSRFFDEKNVNIWRFSFGLFERTKTQQFVKSYKDLLYNQERRFLPFDLRSHQSFLLDFLKKASILEIQELMKNGLF